MRWRPGLRPDPAGGAYGAPPYPLAGKRAGAPREGGGKGGRGRAIPPNGNPGYGPGRGNKHCFCPSVCGPSVAYIANNSRTQRPGVPTFARKVGHFKCNSQISLKVKRSEVTVTRPINADTHRAPYLPNGNAYELQTWYTDGGRRPASAADAMTSKVRGKCRKIT